VTASTHGWLPDRARDGHGHLPFLTDPRTLQGMARVRSGQGSCLALGL